MANPSSSPTQWNVIAALVFVKFTRDNYLLWSSQLESIMESQELVHFIDGTFPPPPDVIMKDSKIERNLDFGIWKRSDRLALSWIKATVSKPVLKQIMFSKSTHETWKMLKKSFGSQSPLRIMLLRKELQFIQKGNMNMHTYLERIKFLADILAAAGIDTDDSDLVQITMNSLPFEYESFIALISANSSNPQLHFLSYSISNSLKRRDLRCSSRQCPTLTDPFRHYRRLKIKLLLILFEDAVEVEATLGVGKEVDSKDEEDNLLSCLNHSMNI
ncbi:hypothetical protein EJ110_NYTH54092 [Nymphaea thermarum]|nr:hypothetical protein EJ110_NYTH54092 [Nymphaea thermarum]